MNKDMQWDEHRRLVAAAGIERKIRQLAKRYGLIIHDMVWNLRHAATDNSPHQLELHVDRLVATLYFGDDELTAYWERPHHYDTDARLGDVLDKLQNASLETLIDAMLPAEIVLGRHRS